MWAKKVNFSYILFFKDLDYTTPLFDANTSNTSKVKSHHHPEIFFVTCSFFHAGTWHMLSFFYWFNLTFFYLFHLFFIFIPLYFAWLVQKKTAGTKGQLVSKCLFVVFNSPKKQTKKIALRYHGSKLNFFVCLLGELKIPKRHFEINWPLKKNTFLLRHSKDYT